MRKPLAIMSKRQSMYKHTKYDTSVFFADRPKAICQQERASPKIDESLAIMSSERDYQLMPMSESEFYENT